jgi:hypothetical protein
MHRRQTTTPGLPIVKRLIKFAGAGVIALTCQIFAQAQPTEKSMVSVVQKTALQAVQADKIDILGNTLSIATEKFRAVRDYQCTLVKQERIDAGLQEEFVALLQVRSQPFSVHVKYQSPKNVAGREAIYVTGKYNGKMKAKGPFGLIGYLTLDVHDPKAMMGTHHAITEVGIGHVLELIGAVHTKLRTSGPDAAHYSWNETTVNRRDCLCIEVIDPKADGKPNTYRSMLYFDKELGLPIRVERYGPPAANGSSGELLEVFTFVDLRLNVGLNDAVFAAER